MQVQKCMANEEFSILEILVEYLELMWNPKIIELKSIHHFIRYVRIFGNANEIGSIIPLPSAITTVFA